MAEWEYAARAGNHHDQSVGGGCPLKPEVGDANLDFRTPAQRTADKENSADDRPSLHGRRFYRRPLPTKAFKPNRWGLYDMDGNVAEFLADCYAKDLNQRRAKLESWQIDIPNQTDEICALYGYTGANFMTKVEEFYLNQFSYRRSYSFAQNSGFRIAKSFPLTIPKELP